MRVLNWITLALALVLSPLAVLATICHNGLIISTRVDRQHDGISY